MSDRELHPFTPDWTLRPGVLLGEELKARGVTEAEFAHQARLGPETVAGVLYGTMRIDGVIAESIGSFLGTSARMWLNAQRIYDDAIARGAKDLSEEHEDG